VNATLKAQHAYRHGAQAIRTHRSLEYDAIARITHALKTATKRGKDGFPDLAAAIHDNRRLWTILATDVADAGNPLPDALRARIFYLAEFTRLHSSKVLNGGASATPLIEVNTAILKGLREQGPNQ
jgi:flagellar protein FlaF